MAKATECRECGKATANRAAFCKGPACRSAWHNRRKARGAELYDFAMAWREPGRPADMLAQLTRLVSAYHTADKALRAGRPSYHTGEALERLPLAYGREGDGR